MINWKHYLEYVLINSSIYNSDSPVVKELVVCVTWTFGLWQNTDAALLPTISYPAFAVDDDALYSQTLDKIVRKLRGKYGFKRFLRDGYRTANEDKNRRYYKPAEMKVGAVKIRKLILFIVKGYYLSSDLQSNSCILSI